MPLHELRRARELTQRDMAKMLKVNQPAVSKMEQRADDMYVSSAYRSYIEAVGGKLKIPVAEFPEGEVAITNFSDPVRERMRTSRRRAREAIESYLT